MNGYGSHCSDTAVMFSTTQTITIIVCQNRYFPVPRTRASRSESLPKVSGSMFSLNRFWPRGWSSRRPGVSSGTVFLQGAVRAGSATVLRQQVVEDVVDCHRADQVVIGVDDRPAGQVVGREV